MTTPIRLNFHITADSRNFETQIAKANKAVAAFQARAGNIHADPIAAQWKLEDIHTGLNRAIAESGQFSQHMRAVKTDGERFSETLSRQKLTLRESVDAIRSYRKENSIIEKSAREQVRMRQSMITAASKTPTGKVMAQVTTAGDVLNPIKGADGKLLPGQITLTQQKLNTLNETLRQGSIKLVDWGKNTQWAGRQMMVGLSLPIGIAVGAATAAFLQLDKELVRIQKVYGSELKFGEDFKKQSDIVREESMAMAKELATNMGQAGATTLKMTADFAATGKEGKELQDAVRETSRLALLGEVGSEEAMKASLSLQTAFKLDTSELSKSVDFLNVVENQTSTSLQDLVEAIPRVGPVIHNLGGGVEELAVLLTALREGGIGAAEGANALKSGLSAMIVPSKDASEYAKKFGINLQSIVDRNKGKLIPMMIDLQKQLAVLDGTDRQEVLTKIFGRYQVGKLSAVFNNLLVDGSQTSKVFDIMQKDASEWRATADQEQAAIVESASGRWKIALEEFKVSLAGIGETFIGPLTGLVEVATGIVKWFDRLPDAIKTVTGVLLGAIAGFGVFVMTLGVVANFLGTVLQGLRKVWAKATGAQPWIRETPDTVAAKYAVDNFDKGFVDADRAIKAMNESLEVTIAKIREATFALTGAGTHSLANGKFFDPNLLSKSNLTSKDLQPVIYGNAANNAARNAKNGALSKDWAVPDFERIAARPGRGVADIAQIGLAAKFLEYRASITGLKDSDNPADKARANQFHGAMSSFQKSMSELDLESDKLPDQIRALVNKLIEASGAADMLAGAMAEAAADERAFARDAYMTATGVGSTKKNGASSDIIPANLIGAVMAEALDEDGRSRVGAGRAEGRLVPLLEDALYAGGLVSTSSKSTTDEVGRPVQSAQGEHIISATTLRDKYGKAVAAGQDPLLAAQAMGAELGLTLEEVAKKLKSYGFDISEHGDAIDVQTSETKQNTKEATATNDKYEASVRGLVAEIIKQTRVIAGAGTQLPHNQAKQIEGALNASRVDGKYDPSKIFNYVEKKYQGVVLPDEEKAYLARKLERLDGLPYAPARQLAPQNVNVGNLGKLTYGFESVTQKVSAALAKLKASISDLGVTSVDSSKKMMKEQDEQRKQNRKYQAGMALSSLSMIGMFANPSGTGAAATGVNVASMAGMGAGMGMMIGPWGAAIGAAAGGAAGFIQKMAERADVAADKLLAMSDAISKASVVSDDLVAALGANTKAQEDAKVVEGAAIATAATATGLGGNYVQSAGYSKIDEVASEMRAEFEKLTSEQALNTAITVYNKLVNQGVARDTATQFIQDLLFAAKQQSIVLDVKAKITELQVTEDVGDIQLFAGRNARDAAAALAPQFRTQMESNQSQLPWVRNILDDGQLSADMTKLLDPVALAFAESLSTQIANVFSQSDSWMPYAQEAGKNFGTILSGTMTQEFMKDTNGRIYGEQDLNAMGITNVDDMNALANQYLQLDATQRATFQAISDNHKEFSKVVERESDIAAKAMLSMYSPGLQTKIADFADKLAEGEDGLTRYQATVSAAAMITDTEFRGSFDIMTKLITDTGSFGAAVEQLGKTDIGLADKFQTLAPFIERNRNLIAEYNKTAAESDQITGPQVDSVALAMAEAQMAGINIQLADFAGYDGTTVSINIRQKIERELSIARWNSSVDAFTAKGNSMMQEDSVQQDTGEVPEDAAAAADEENKALEKAAKDAEEAAKDASDDRINAIEKEIKAKEKLLDKGVADAQKAFEKEIAARQKAAKEEFDAVINGLRRIAEEAEKQRQAEIEAVRKASEDRQEQLRNESEAVTKFYDDKIQAINDEAEAAQKREDAERRAEEAEKRRIARAKEMLDLQLAMAEGVAKGDAFAVLSAQMNMSTAQDNWNVEDKQIASEEKKRLEDEARAEQIKKLEEERDAKVKAIETVAEAEQVAYDARIERMQTESDAKKKADEDEIAWKQAVGEAMLAQRQEQDQAIIDQKREADAAFVEAEKEKNAAMLEAKREEEADALELFNEASQANLEAQKAANDVEVAQEGAKDEAIKLSRQAVAAAVDAAWLLAGNNIDNALKALDEQFGLTGDAALQALAAIKPELASVLTLMSELGIQSGVAATMLGELMKVGADGRAALTADRIKELYSSSIAAVRGVLPNIEPRAQDELAARLVQMQDQINRSISGFASGGAIFGPGTQTSDSIPARLSNGEFVIKAAAVTKYGRGLFEMLNAQKFADGGIVGGAAGAAAVVLPAGTATENVTGDIVSSAKAVGDARVQADVDAQQSDADLAAQKQKSITDALNAYLNSVAIMQGKFNDVLALQLDGLAKTDKANYASFVAKTAQENSLNETKLRNFQAIYLAQISSLITDQNVTDGKIANAETLARIKSELLAKYTQQHTVAEASMAGETNVRAMFTIQALQSIASTSKSVTDSMMTQWTGWADGTKLLMVQVADALKGSFANINYDALVKMVEAYASGKTSEGDTLKAQVLKKADGGYISGPGTGTSDSIPALLSNGEYVVRQRSVQKYGASFLNQINEGRFAEGGMVGALSTGVSSVINKAIERKIQDAILRRSTDYAESSTGAMIDWSKVPPGAFSSPFGYWTTYSGGNHGSDGRGARDYQAGMGSPIHAAGPGVVSRTEGGSYPDNGDGSGSGGGNWVIIDHNIPGKGVYSSVYMHMQQGSMKARVGDIVDTSKVIGNVGNSGSSQGAHLHFEFAPGAGQVQRAMTYLFESVTGAPPVSFNNGVTGESGGPGMFGFAANKMDLSKIGANPAGWKFTSGSPATTTGSTGTPWNGAPIPGISENVMRWATLVQDTMKELQIPSQYISGILRQIQQESGGDPNAVNNWDSNALAGTPSKGLLQTIVPTFLSYARATQRDPNLVTDPSANIYAALNYVLARYGMGKFDLWNQGFNQGYSGGGLVIPALRRGATINYDNTLANLHRGETVLTAPLTKRLQENVASGGETSYNVTVKIDKASATAQEIEDAVFGALDKHTRKMGRSRVVGRR